MSAKNRGGKTWFDSAAVRVKKYKGAIQDLSDRDAVLAILDTNTAPFDPRDDASVDTTPAPEDERRRYGGILHGQPKEDVAKELLWNPYELLRSDSNTNKIQIMTGISEFYNDALEALTTIRLLLNDSEVDQAKLFQLIPVILCEINEWMAFLQAGIQTCLEHKLPRFNFIPGRLSESKIREIRTQYDHLRKAYKEEHARALALILEKYNSKRLTGQVVDPPLPDNSVEEVEKEITKDGPPSQSSADVLPPTNGPTISDVELEDPATEPTAEDVSHSADDVRLSDKTESEEDESDPCLEFQLSNLAMCSCCID